MGKLGGLPIQIIPSQHAQTMLPSLPNSQAMKLMNGRFSTLLVPLLFAKADQYGSFECPRKT